MKSKLLIVAVIGAMLVANWHQAEAVTDSNSGGDSYFSQTLKLFDTGLAAHDTARSYNEMVSKDDPRTVKMLRDNVNKATDLINNYRRNGLSNMPSLPNLPGLNLITRLPDKLLRAELSMLQDEIRMAEEMLQNPITATLNAPREIAVMLSRMASQLEQ